MKPSARPYRNRGWAVALLFSGFALLLVPAHRSRASSKDLFKKANAAYEEGRFEEAVRLYEELASSKGIAHPDLWYNLGNAHYRCGRLGPAIYWYERALKLDPYLADARYNLKVARKQAAARVKDKPVGAEKDPWWVRAVSAFGPNSLAVGFLLLWYLSLGLAIALFYLGRNVWKALAITGTGLFGAAALAFGLLLLGQVHLDRTVNLGVVLPDAVKVLEGPRENAATAFSVHAGLKVRILEADVEWYKIRLSNGDEGWIKRKQVGRL